MKNNQPAVNEFLRRITREVRKHFKCDGLIIIPFWIDSMNGGFQSEILFDAIKPKTADKILSAIGERAEELQRENNPTPKPFVTKETASFVKFKNRNFTREMAKEAKEWFLSDAIITIPIWLAEADGVYEKPHLEVSFINIQQEEAYRLLSDYGRLAKDRLNQPIAV